MSFAGCPPQCHCSNKTSDELSVNCNNADFDSTPSSLPHETTELHLSRNRIQNLTHDDFVGCSKLSLIDLSHNGLLRIENTTFSNLSRMQSLSLFNNSIVYFPRSVFSGMLNLKYLDIRFCYYYNFEDRPASYLTEFFLSLPKSIETLKTNVRLNDTSFTVPCSYLKTSQSSQFTLRLITSEITLSSPWNFYQLQKLHLR